MGKSTSVLVVLFSVVFIRGLEVSCSGVGYSNVSCIDSERKALLKFRESLTDETNRLSSWVGEDCCRWKGVVCSKKAGHVLKLDLHNPTLCDDDINSCFYDANYSRTLLGGEISTSLLHLKHLHYLDLSMNNFSGIQIPEFLGSLENLRYLNLSLALFRGKVPHHLGNLSSLHYLDLHGSPFVDDALFVDSLRWVSKLSSLKYLDLSVVSLLRTTDWLQSINMLSSLLVLNLANCKIFTNSTTLPYVNFTSLTSLNLQYNFINSTIPLWLFNVSGLMHLNLKGNNFYGPIPDTLGTWTSLTVLDLSNNMFNWTIPNSLGNLSSLVYLDLSRSEFQGSIPSTIRNLHCLVYLDLSWNEFQGSIPPGIRNLCSLRELSLSFNRFSGEIPSFEGSLFGCFQSLERLILSSNFFRGPIPVSLGSLSNLRELDVSNNLLNGCIPLSLGHLSRLEILDISYNQLTGIVSEFHFSKLARLTTLLMSSNLFVFNVTSHWVPPFQLKTIELQSCKLGPQFPSWLQTQTSVHMLNISNANISDTMPHWFDKLYSDIVLLDLSKNDIHGKLPIFLESNYSFEGNRVLILKSNKFNGSLGPFPSDLYALDLSDNLLSGHISPLNFSLNILILSNNLLSGGVPMFLCDQKWMQIIDLSRNQLSGRLPSCLGDLDQLKVLDLTDNKLYGEIPSSLGSLSSLESLYLRNNMFSGKLPLSLQNLTHLTILDLGRNGIIDIISPWIGEKLQSLKYLSLQSNKFYGSIPQQLCWLSTLQLLNLAHNSITGNIPPCFGNFTAMIMDLSPSLSDNPRGFFEDNVMESIKGEVERRYTKTMPFLISMDLANNHLCGEIPEDLTYLIRLRNLNLAENHLNGGIPKKIGNLKQLESLDLSKNELSGPIPPSFVDLNFLSHLNLSFNNLSGQVPRGNQLQTLDDQSIYAGNSELCGAPLLKSCLDDKPSPNHEHVESEGEDEFELLWFYAGIGPGFSVGFLAVCCTLYFKKSWRYAYFGLIENVYNRLLLASALTAARLQRKFTKGEIGA